MSSAECVKKDGALLFDGLQKQIQTASRNHILFIRGIIQ